MKKYIKKISISIILVIISLTAIFYVKADSGWDSDYGGGSDWSSSDWEGSDYDSNYGSFTGSTEDIIFLVVVLSGLTAIIVIAAIYYNKNKKQYLNKNEVSDELFNKYFTISKKKFKKHICNIYLNIENYKMNFNYNDLKELCTDDMYNTLKKDMEYLQNKNYKHIRTNIKPKLIIIRNIKEIDGNLYVIVGFNYFVKDYVINNNKIISGNISTLKFEFHDLTFVDRNDNFILDKDKLFKNDKDNKIFDGNNTDNTSYQNVSDNDYNNYFTISKEELKNKINKHFIDVQKSWMNFNYDNLRKLCTDELYNQYKTQLETLKLKNEQNIMSDFNVKEVSIYDIKKVNNIIEISVYLDIKFRDYVINTNSKKIVRGNKKIYFNNSYELTFVMSNNNKLTSCPSCGAQVEVVSSNVCPYCKNTIVQNSNELILSKKKIVSSRKTNS